MSTCPKNILLQQYLSTPSSSKTTSGFFSFKEALYGSYKWPITEPHVKHLTGNSIHSPSVFETVFFPNKIKKEAVASGRDLKGLSPFK
jgi:hypothetical protein